MIDSGGINAHEYRGIAARLISHGRSHSWLDLMCDGGQTFGDTADFPIAIRFSQSEGIRVTPFSA